MVHVAAVLGLGDLLADGVRPVEELAERSGAHAPSLHRLLRGLAALGVLEEAGDGRFQLTEMGRLLGSETPNSLRGTAMSAGGEMGTRAWGNLLHSVKTGQTAFDHTFGKSAFDYFAENPEISAAFNKSMVAGTRQVAPSLIAAYDFSRFPTIVDVGGGSGALIAAILEAAPGSRGVLFDTPAGLESARGLLDDAGLADRCDVVEGDFFQFVPEGGDAYLVKSIIHDWDDERSLTILENCRVAMSKRARLLVIEPLLPERADSSEPARTIVMSDLNMLVNTGGRERTREEFEALFADAGLRLSAAIATDAPFGFSVIEGQPA